VLADRLDEASAAPTQPEAELAVALDVDCAVEGGEEAPSERHDVPCAVRYTKDTQFDITANLHQLHSGTHVDIFCCKLACNGMKARAEPDHGAHAGPRLERCLLWLNISVV
jgi:hypothetical protein